MRSCGIGRLAGFSEHRAQEQPRDQLLKKAQAQAVGAARPCWAGWRDNREALATKCHGRSPPWMRTRWAGGRGEVGRGEAASHIAAGGTQGLPARAPAVPGQASSEDDVERLGGAGFIAPAQVRQQDKKLAEPGDGLFMKCRVDLSPIEGGLNKFTHEPFVRIPIASKDDLWDLLQQRAREPTRKVGILLALAVRLVDGTLPSCEARAGIG
eukprot:scaffold965_cov120-Isochrysis_galbana.AAC.5